MTSRRHSYEYVRKRFEDRGCELLSKDYVRSKDKLRYKCICGEEARISFDKFNSGQLCGKCARRRAGKSRRHSYQYVKRVFEGRGSTLVSSEYVNGHAKLKYICACGNKSEITFFKFRSGQDCRECGNRKISEKLREENSYMYDPSKTDEERIRDRKYPAYYEWRRKVFERDGFTCQSCFDRGVTVNAHHVESYARNKDLRTNISNGMTLCERCHQEYHTAFYRNDATEKTLKEFLNGEHDPIPDEVK